MSIPLYLLGINYSAGTPRGFGPALPLPPRWIVIHDTGNTAAAAAEAHYAATRTDDRGSWTSAHFYVDQAQVLGSVPLTEQAWAAFANANAHAWQVEMCGQDAGDPGAVPQVTLERTAKLVAELVRLGGRPVRHVDPAGIAAGTPGICGHLDFTEEEHRAGGHTDPGYRFDWDHFLHLVDADLGGTPAPVPTPQPKGDPVLNNWTTVRKGDTGAEVKVVEGLLLAHGLPVGCDPNHLDGIAGPVVDGSIRILQSRYGIAVDGQFGPHTLSVAVVGRDVAA